MQVWKHASMQICKYASMQVCEYASMQICKYASMQVCMYASMQVCNMLIDRYTDSLSSKFYEDPFIGCREIAETKMSMHFYHF